MIAVTLLALATIVAIGSLPTLTVLSNRGRCHVAASELAQSLLEQQRGKPWSSLPVPPAHIDLEPVVLPGTGIEFRPILDVYQVDTPVPVDPQNLRHLVVTVGWLENGARKQLHHEISLVRLQH
ncbi:hypothetical protein IV102_13400 [bacterium]|nr:hypothetical protein [bacterium]